MKKKMKALLAVALVGVMALGLAACSSGSSSSSTSTEDSSSSSSSSSTTEGSSSSSSTDTTETSTTGVVTPLRFVTGGESGTYYAYGSVLAQFATNGDYGLEITALSSDGSQANIQSLEDDDADIAFCQSDVLSYAYEGTNLFEDSAYKDFGVVAALYQEQVQIVTCDPSIESVADLAGKKVCVGAANSGTYFNAVDVLDAYEMTLDDIDPVYQSFADSTDSLKNETIDAAFVVAGAPTTSITDLSTSKTAYLVSMDEEHVDKLLESSPYYAKATVSADAYGLDSDTTTVSVGAVIIANDTISEDAIYNLTASLFDGAEENAAAHAKYAELSLDEASALTSVPYHSGAAKYYEEQGITVKSK